MEKIRVAIMKICELVLLIGSIFQRWRSCDLVPGGQLRAQAGGQRQGARLHR